MRPIVERATRLGKLSYLWLVRILGAPDHYRVSKRRKLAMNAQGFLADQYELYDLGNNSKEDYLSEFDWYRSRWINHPFDPMLNNKVICTEVLQPVCFVPKIVLVKNDGRMWTYSRPERQSTLEDALGVIRSSKSVFMKPIGAGKGTGVHRISAPGAEDTELWDLDGVAVPVRTIERLLEGADGWFFSETIDQHPDIAKVFPDATNTVRIITLRDPDTGAPKVFFAVFRIGTRDTVPVDNGSRGGMVSLIDLETGALSAARTLWSPEAHAVHPDTGEQIAGITLPGWAQVKAEALRLANRFPYLQFVAWDMLITESGPCVIEANTSSGVNILQIWGPQKKGELGDFYRAHGVIK